MKVFTAIVVPKIAPKEVDSLSKHVGLNVAEGVMLVDEIDKGFAGDVANRIMSWAQITQADLRRMTGIPSTTFSRSIKSHFSADQSERLVRFIRVVDRTLELFEGDKKAALQWLNEPNRALVWKTPAELLASEAGAYEIMKLITRIEHGVYS